MYQPEPTNPRTRFSRKQKIGAAIVAFVVLMVIVGTVGNHKDKAAAPATAATTTMVTPTLAGPVRHSAPATVPKTTASEDSLTDQAFLQVVRDKIAGMKNVSDQTLITQGQSMCGMLDDGASLPIVAKSLMHDADIDVADAGYFLGAAAAAYCPQHRGLFDE